MDVDATVAEEDEASEETEEKDEEMAVDGEQKSQEE